VKKTHPTQSMVPPNGQLFGEVATNQLYDGIGARLPTRLITDLIKGVVREVLKKLMKK